VSPLAHALPRAWLIVAMLWVVAMLNYLDRIMITTMHESLTAAIPMTEKQFGPLTTVFLFIYGLLSPFGGFLADRFNRSRLIVVSLVVWSLLTWLTGHVKSYEQLLVVRGLMGVSEAAYLPAALALIADYHRGATRSLATGIHMTGISVGSGMAGVAGWLAERHGWSFAFDVFGGFGVAYAVVLALVIREAPKESALAKPAEQPEGVRLGRAVASLFSDGSFLLLLGYWSLFGLAGWAVASWMPIYFKERFGLSQGAAGISATAYLYAAAFCGKFIGGAWADLWSRHNLRGRTWVPMIGMFVAAPATVMVAGTPVLAVAIVGLSIYGMMRSFSDANLMPILCQVADPRYRATGYGLLNMFSCLVGGAAVFAGGAMRDAHIGVSTLFVGAAAALLLCGVFLMFVRPKADR
jgi:MFS family permease